MCWICRFVIDFHSFNNSGESPVNTMTVVQ